MTAIQVPGLLFETEDSDALNAHAATREVMLRSTLDARFVLYHHVIRRRVAVDLEAQFRRSASPPYRCALEGTAGLGPAVRQRPVHHADPPSCARQGRSGRACIEEARKGRRASSRPIPRMCARCERPRNGLVASLQAYGASIAGRLRRAARQDELRNARVALRALQWRNAPGAPARRRYRYRPDAALSPRQLRARCDGTARRGRARFRCHARSQGLSRRHQPRPARRLAAPAVRNGRDGKLRAGRTPDRARADGSGDPPSEDLPTKRRWPNAPTCWRRAMRWATARWALAIIT